VSCTGCKGSCEEGAISFPSLLELRDVMKSLRKKYDLLTE
jgi:ferredoxin